MPPVALSESEANAKGFAPPKMSAAYERAAVKTEPSSPKLETQPTRERHAAKSEAEKDGLLSNR